MKKFIALYVIVLLFQLFTAHSAQAGVINLERGKSLLAGFDPKFTQQLINTGTPKGPYYYESCPDSPTGKCFPDKKPGSGFYTLFYDDTQCALNSAELYDSVGENLGVPCPFYFQWKKEGDKSVGYVAVDSRKFKSASTKNLYIGIQENASYGSVESKNPMEGIYGGLDLRNINHSPFISNVESIDMDMRAKICYSEKETNVYVRLASYIGWFKSGTETYLERSQDLSLNVFTHIKGPYPSFFPNPVAHGKDLGEGLNYNTLHVDGKAYVKASSDPFLKDTTRDCSKKLSTQPWVSVKIPFAEMATDLINKGYLKKDVFNASRYSGGIVAGIEAWGKAKTELEVKNYRINLKTPSDTQAPFGKITTVSENLVSGTLDNPLRGNLGVAAIDIRNMNENVVSTCWEKGVYGSVTNEKFSLNLPKDEAEHTYAICASSDSIVRIFGYVTIAGSKSKAPTISLTSEPYVDHGSAPILSWSVIPAATCTVSSSNNDTKWTGRLSTSSGKKVVSPIITAQTYKIACVGSNGEKSERSLLVKVNPNIRFSASPESVDANQSATLTWTVTNAAKCTASGDWAGEKALVGEFKTAPLTQAKTYTLTCFKPNEIIGQKMSVVIKIKPTIVLNSSSLLTLRGTQTTLNWKVTNAEKCDAFGGWAGAKALSGSEKITITSPTNFGLTCYKPDGFSASKSFTAKIISPIQSFCHTFSTIINQPGNTASQSVSASEIRFVQTMLEKEGLTIASAEKTAGTYGETTKEAMKVFKSLNGMPADSIFGPGAIAAANKKYACVTSSLERESQIANVIISAEKIVEELKTFVRSLIAQ
ncbi:MAG: peptidoglycan-binding protein [Candidatus Paceibacterota bacterium]|jgi:hypothetical protein